MLMVTQPLTVNIQGPSWFPGLKVQLFRALNSLQTDFRAGADALEAVNVR